MSTKQALVCLYSLDFFAPFCINTNVKKEIPNRDKGLIVKYLILK